MMDSNIHSKKQKQSNLGQAHLVTVWAVDVVPAAQNMPRHMHIAWRILMVSIGT
jgi:hypothetical protein